MISATWNDICNMAESFHREYLYWIDGLWNINYYYVIVLYSKAVFPDRQTGHESVLIKQNNTNNLKR